MKTIIADGGSTKIDWLLRDNGTKMLRHTSKGLNPSLLDVDDIRQGLMAVVSECPELLDAETVEFYGSGCTAVASPKMKSCLAHVFPKAGTIVVDSDIIGAAKALYGEDEGIACILGTGACSCQWGRRDDGTMGIIRQTPALGYILGDEGSGAVLGRLFLNALYKGVLPPEMRVEFEREYGVDMFGVIDKVYRQPQANRWLASLSPFVYRHIDDAAVAEIVGNNIRAFFERNILPYNRPDLTVSFVGSIAFYYEKQLRSEAAKLNIEIGRILKSPLT